MHIAFLLLVACQPPDQTLPVVSESPEGPALSVPPDDIVEAEAPDILFIVLDTVRADRLGTYGGPHPTSPALTRLVARRGVRFDQATSVASWTWPSHASLFTGTPPWVHGAHFGSPSDGAMQMGPDPFHATTMNESLPTLAGRLTEAGYQSVSLSANRLISADFGLTRGFQQARYLDTDLQVWQAAEQVLAEADDEPLLLFVNLYGAHAPFEIQAVPWLENRPELNEETAPDWLRPFLRREASRIHFMRSPAPGERIGAFSYMRGDWEIPADGIELLRDVYDGEIRAVDYYMGQIIEAWQATRSPDSIIVVTSDHGEMLGERQLMEHGRSLAHELLHVPLVVSAPSRWPTDEVISTPVQPHTIMHTLLFFAGIEEDGGSLDRAVRGIASEEPILAAAWRDHFWAREVGERFDQGYRYYREGHEAILYGTNTGLEYYRLDEDPQHLDNLSSQYGTRSEALRERADGHFTESAATPAVTTPIDAMEALQELGYIDSVIDE